MLCQSVGRLLIFILFVFFFFLCLNGTGSCADPLPALVDFLLSSSSHDKRTARIFGSGMFAQLFADNPVLLFNKSCRPSLQTARPA